MKKNTFALLAICTAFSIHSQVLLHESFTSPFNPVVAGWTILNNSIPSNTISWTQGNGTGGTTSFPAYTGSPNDFYCADFLSVPQGSGGISAWLISPVLTIYNGAVLEFATRTAAASPVFPDRMQVRMSQSPLTAIPAGSASVGSFTNLLLDINPNLTINTNNAVSNGTVNGYPQSWTTYSLQISGVTGTVIGRFAFRYFVDNGGSAGTNSRMIGLDEVKYSLPCSPTVESYTVCSGNTVTLVATGGLPATTYQWSSGSTTSVEIVTPTVTTVYTLTPGNGTISCGTQITATVTIGSQLSMSISSSAQPVCPGQSVTLTAISAATNYTWSNGGNSPVKLVNPGSSTVYSVSGVNGTCAGNATIGIIVTPNPNLSYVIPYVRCASHTMNISAFGASNYTWTLGTQVFTTNPVTVLNPSNTIGGSYTLGLKGMNSSGCSATSILVIPYSAIPSLSFSAVGNAQCADNTSTITVTGAHTYTWTGDASSNSNLITVSNGASATVKNFSVTGTSTATGCSAKTTYSYAVSLCTGIDAKSTDPHVATVFPNPFSNELHFSGSVQYVEIYNSMGELQIRQFTTHHEAIETSKLAKGLYILKAYSDSAPVRVMRILKN